MSVSPQTDWNKWRHTKSIGPSTSVEKKNGRYNLLGDKLKFCDMIEQP